MKLYRTYGALGEWEQCYVGFTHAYIISPLQGSFLVFTVFVIITDIKIHEDMKKEYFEPTMRVANLKHKHHLLQSSGGQSKPNLNQWGDKSFGTFDDDDDVIIDDDDVI